MFISNQRIDWWFIKDIVILIIPVFLLFIPMEWLNGQHTICLIKNIFGVECPGCGITRAVVSTMQLDFTGAFNYNKLIIIVFPLLAYAWIKTFISVIKTFREKH